MSETSLLLGPVAFRDFEVPSLIGFGGSQLLAVHRMPGGARVIDALGPDETDITFAGIFTGQDASARALELDALRLAGLPLPLTWDVFFYLVLISNFQAVYSNSAWIPYQITCTVLFSELTAVAAVAASLLTAASGDADAAALAAAPAGIDLSAPQAALAAPGAATSGTSAYAAAQASLGAAQGAIGGGINGAETILDGSTLLGPGTAQSGIAALTSAVGAAGTLGTLVNAQSYIGRASANLDNAST